MTSPLVGSIEFLKDFGFFDVVLPFLFVFTIFFAILEKTRVFGTEGKDKEPRKNVNAMVAFTVAFFVIATKEAVSFIQVSLPHVAMILLVIICFMLLVGSFMGEGGFSLENHTAWKVFLMTIIFIGMILISLNALGWLETPLEFIIDNWDTPIISTFIFLGVIALVVWAVVGGGKKKKEKD